MENKNIHKIGKELFITSDEEIKEGDWFLTDDKRVEKCAPYWRAREWHKKIILTTDQDLIKDGVQAIDDEFLEWFVKNPSFEFVDVKLFYNQCMGECGICDNSCGNWYETIFPKEEHKQVWKQIIETCGGEEEFMKSAGLKPKQETTLEEVVNNFKKTDVYINEIKQEQERNYSEEDMKEAFNVGFNVGYNDETSPSFLTFEKWIEQFKKK